MHGPVTEVVVTGIGVVCAAGRGAEALRAALARDAACAAPADSALPVERLAGVPEPVPEHPAFPDDRKAWLAFAAAEEALACAGEGGPRPFEGRKVAVYAGTGLSSVTPDELARDLYPFLTGDSAGELRFDRVAMARDLAGDRPAPRRHLPARVTQALADRVGATGPVGTSFSACAAAAQAIAEGLWSLRRGEADVALVGGHDSMVHPMGLLSFVVLGALSPGVARPFDRRRDGFLLGEGAAFLVLETETAARARGAAIRGRVLGAGTSVDAWNATAPHPEGRGAERAMRHALRDAGLPASAVGYVNAHGTGTPLGDLAESLAVARVFGSVPISSIKGAVGHTIAAAGAVEAAACLLALEAGFLPGTVGFEQPDPACPLPVLASARGTGVEVCVSNSFGFGGQNASLVLARGDGLA